jgi:hypothetical protein
MTRNDDCRALAAHFTGIVQAAKDRGKRFATMDIGDLEEAVELLAPPSGRSRIRMKPAGRIRLIRDLLAEVDNRLEVDPDPPGSEEDLVARRSLTDLVLCVRHLTTLVDLATRESQ